MILTNENYFSPEMNKKYMSVSQFKDFAFGCEAMAMAKINGECKEEKTIPLLVGSYVDSYFEGTLDKFKVENPEIFTTRLIENEYTVAKLAEVGGGFVTRNFTLVAKKIKEAKEIYPEFFTIKSELKSDYIKADEIIKRIESDVLFMQFMSGEKQIIKTAGIEGVPFKIKIDSLLPDKIVDLKCMRSIEPVMGKSFIEYWNYDIQLAVYQKVYEISTGEKLPTYIAVATKESVTNLEIIHIPQWRLDECLEYVKRELQHIIKVKNGEIHAERCGVCDYCKQTKVLTAPIDFMDAGYSTKDLKAMRGES